MHHDIECVLCKWKHIKVVEMYFNLNSPFFFNLYKKDQQWSNLKFKISHKYIQYKQIHLHVVEQLFASFIRKGNKKTNKKNPSQSAAPLIINHCSHAESAGCTRSCASIPAHFYQRTGIIFGGCENVGWHGSWGGLSITMTEMKSVTSWPVYHHHPTPSPHSVSPPLH